MTANSYPFEKILPMKENSLHGQNNYRKISAEIENGAIDLFREMRRRNQQLPLEDCQRILQTTTSGVLAVAGDDSYPYAVPLSFAYADGRLYFHVAKSGHKLDALRRNPKASFCVIEQDEVVPKEYTTYFRSVIAFGKIRIVEDNAEKRRGLDLLADKYSPHETTESREAEIGKLINALYVLEMDIEHLTGKEGREFAEQRKNKPTTEKSAVGKV